MSVHTDARYYEPNSGRFLSADPLGQASSPSLYDFAGGDPVNRFDPTGRCPGSSPTPTPTPQDVQDYYRRRLDIAKKALRSVLAIYGEANAQFYADAELTTSLAQPFETSNPIDFAEQGQQTLVPVAQSAAKGGNFAGTVDGVDGTLSALFGPRDFFQGPDKFENGEELAGASALGFAVVTTGAALIKGATLGPRPILYGDGALAEAAEVVGTTAAGRGIVAFGAVGLARIQANSADAASSEATVDAITANVTSMIASYNQLVSDAQAAGVSP